MVIITKTKSNQVEKFDSIQVLKEFKDMFIGHLRYKESNLNGHKILCDIDGIERMVDNVIQVIMTINECEHPYLDEEDIPI